MRPRCLGNIVESSSRRSSTLDHDFPSTFITFRLSFRGLSPPPKVRIRIRNVISPRKPVRQEPPTQNPQRPQVKERRSVSTVFWDSGGEHESGSDCVHPSDHTGSMLIIY